MLTLTVVKVLEILILRGLGKHTVKHLKLGVASATEQGIGSPQVRVAHKAAKRGEDNLMPG